MTFILFSLKSRVKATVISAYCHGLVPADITQWIIQIGGLRHD
jgi:hypothetical protein